MHWVLSDSDDSFDNVILNWYVEHCVLQCNVKRLASVI